MTAKVLKRKWSKTLIAVLLIFALAVSIVAFFVNRYWSPILAAKVRSTVLSSTDSLYHADFTDANLHIIQGKLVIFNLTFKPDMDIYHQRMQKGLAPNNLYTIKVKRIVLKHIHPLKMYFDNQLDIGQIVLSAPELQVSYRQLRRHDTTATDHLNAWQRIKPMLKSIHIGQIMLNDVNFKYKDYTGNQLQISALKEINLTGKDLLIDSTTQNDASRYFYFKDIQVELNNFTRASANGLYRYKINQLRYSTLTSQLNAFGVALLPAGDNVFEQRKIRTWFSFNTDTLQLNGFSLKNYNKYRLLYGSSLLLTRGNLLISANPALQAPKTNRLRTFPNAAIYELNNNFTLDTILLNRINITYKAYGKKSHKQGMISFNNTRGMVLNVTNEPLIIQHNNIARVQLNTMLMDSGPMQADVAFNLTDSARSYAYKGSVGPMDMDKLNKATMPFGLIKITSGRLDKFSFDIKGNSRISAGKVTMLYHGLKVRLLKIDTLDNRYRHQAIASLMANALIVKDSNPDKPGSPARTFKVSYTRQPDTPFFTAVWKTLAQGIKASAGYDADTERQVKAHIARYNQDQASRRAKREQRQQRRALRKSNNNDEQ